MAPKVSRTVIPNGIPIADFERQPGARPSIFELEKTGPIVGCVARLSKEKGVDYFLAAAALMPSVQFMVAGDGPELGSLHKSAPPNVEFAGRVANIREFYQALDVLVVPSRSEGQGIVALEAMASGCPVIASKVGGLASMLTDNTNALLVPVGDVASIANSVQKLLHNTELRDRLVSNGRDLVTHRYSDDQMLTSTLTVYDSVLGLR
jgi:glycosyltransferase involved in cell wall biosynthesis